MVELLQTTECISHYMNKSELIQHSSGTECATGWYECGKIKVMAERLGRTLCSVPGTQGLVHSTCEKPSPSGLILESISHRSYCSTIC